MALGSFCHAIKSTASDIQWVATNTSAAWVTPGNWAGSLYPGETDVAVFGQGVLTGGVAGILMQSTNLPAKGDARIGAIHLLAERKNAGVTVGNSSTASAGVFSFYGAEVNGVANTILSNDSNQSLAIMRNVLTGSTTMTMAIQAGRDSVVQVNGAGNITLGLAVTGVGSRLVIQGSGAGKTILSGTDSTYSGGTLLRQGTLVIEGKNASGSGAITNEAGRVEIAAGTTVTSRIILAGVNASFSRHFMAGDALSAFRVESSLGGSNTVLTIQGGVASVARSGEARFSSTATAVNDQGRVGDVLTLSGLSGDIHVVQLAIEDAVTSGYFLAWLQSGEWMNAGESLEGRGGLAQAGVVGSFATSGLLANADYLGSWGVDVAANSVWAVVNSDGVYTVMVPEPGSWAMLGITGAGFLLFFRSNRSARRSA